MTEEEKRDEEAKEAEFRQAHERLDHALARVQDAAHEILDEGSDAAPRGPLDGLRSCLGAVVDSAEALQSGNPHELEEELETLASLALMALADMRAPGAHERLEDEAGCLDDDEIRSLASGLRQRWAPVDPAELADIMGEWTAVARATDDRASCK